MQKYPKLLCIHNSALHNITPRQAAINLPFFTNFCAKFHGIGSPGLIVMLMINECTTLNPRWNGGYRKKGSPTLRLSVCWVIATWSRSWYLTPCFQLVVRVWPPKHVLIILSSNKTKWNLIADWLQNSQMQRKFNLCVWRFMVLSPSRH